MQPEHLELEMTRTRARTTASAPTAARWGVEVGRHRVEVGRGGVVMNLVDHCDGVEVGFRGVEVG